MTPEAALARARALLPRVVLPPGYTAQATLDTYYDDVTRPATAVRLTVWLRYPDPARPTADGGYLLGTHVAQVDISPVLFVGTDREVSGYLRHVLVERVRLLALEAVTGWITSKPVAAGTT